MGQSVSKLVFKAQTLFGCDFTSNSGKEIAILKKNPKGQICNRFKLFKKMF